MARGSGLNRGRLPIRNRGGGPGGRRETAGIVRSPMSPEHPLVDFTAHPLRGPRGVVYNDWTQNDAAHASTRLQGIFPAGRRRHPGAGGEIGRSRFVDTGFRLPRDRSRRARRFSARVGGAWRADRPLHVSGGASLYASAGAVGYFAYDAVRQLENIGEHAKDDFSLPDCLLMFYDRLLAFDHLRHQIHIIATADVSRESPRKAYDRAVADIALLEKKLGFGLRPGQWQKPSSRRTRKL